MNFTLPLTADEEAKLLAEARAKGTTPEALVREAIAPILAAVPDEVPQGKHKKNFAQFLRDSPLPGSGLKLERQKDYPSPIDL